jgi:DNA-binding MarR family transcriptional regulator
MSSEQVQTLIERIDQLTRVIAIDAVKDKPPSDQVSILNGLGFTQIEIASATGMTQGNVSKILSKLKTKSAANHPKRMKVRRLERP